MLHFKMRHFLCLLIVVCVNICLFIPRLWSLSSISLATRRESQPPRLEPTRRTGPSVSLTNESPVLGVLTNERRELPVNHLLGVLDPV